MQHLINITAGNPKTVEQYQLTKEFDVVWFFTEDGKNWYEEQKYFADDTIKIAYDKDNIIRYVEKDVTAIRPDGLSVVEVPDITAKEGANKRGNSSRLTQSFHFFMFEPIFSPVNALNQPI